MFNNFRLKSLWNQLVDSNSSSKQLDALIKIRNKRETEFMNFLAGDNLFRFEKALTALSNSNSNEIKTYLSNCIWNAFYNNSQNAGLANDLKKFFDDSTLPNQVKKDLISVMIQRMRTPLEMVRCSRYLPVCDSSTFEQYLKPIIEEALKEKDPNQLITTSTLVLLARFLGKKASSIIPILEQHIPSVDDVLKCDIISVINNIESNFHPNFVKQFCEIVSNHGTLEIELNLDFTANFNANGLKNNVLKATLPYLSIYEFISLPLKILPTDIYSLSSSIYSKLLSNWKRVRISWDFIDYCSSNEETLKLACSTLINDDRLIIRGLSAIALRYSPKDIIDELNILNYLDKQFKAENNPIVKMYLERTIEHITLNL